MRQTASENDIHEVQRIRPKLSASGRKACRDALFPAGPAKADKSAKWTPSGYDPAPPFSGPVKPPVPASTTYSSTSIMPGAISSTVSITITSDVCIGEAERGLRAGRRDGCARRALLFRACGRFADFLADDLALLARFAVLRAGALLREVAGLRDRAAELFFAVLLRDFEAVDFARRAVVGFFFAALDFFAFEPRFAAADERFFAAAISPPSSEIIGNQQCNAFHQIVERGMTADRMPGLFAGE